MDIVKVVRQVIVKAAQHVTNPAVYISGGIDSTIVLHHLSELYVPIKTYTLDFGYDNGTLGAAARVADAYATVHSVVDGSNFINDLPEIMKHFDRPRYNAWPYYLAKAAAADFIDVAFTGEGGDENFGYDDRPYLVGWANNIAYAQPAYEWAHRAFDITVRHPLTTLPWISFLPFWGKGKRATREAYRPLLPWFVVTAGAQPPAFVDYYALWEQSLKDVFPDKKPTSKAEIVNLLQLYATKAWLVAHQGR